MEGGSEYRYDFHTVIGMTGRDAKACQEGAKAVSLAIAPGVACVRLDDFTVKIEEGW